jgi:ComF family protein
VSAADLLVSLRDAAVTLFYPRACQLCGGSVENPSDDACCRKCWENAKFFTGAETVCEKCGRVLETAAKRIEKTFCRRCDGEHFDAARAVGVYEGALRLAVINLKEKPAVSERVKTRLAELSLKTPFNQATMIIPVPLHRRRLHERGFNQAAVLARILSQKTKLPCLENCLVRETYSAMHRAGMDEKSRRESVEKSFAVKQPRLIKDENILLVDDVFTSGATASVCAKALKENGAAKVFVVTIARAV